MITIKYSIYPTYYRQLFITRLHDKILMILNIFKNTVVGSKMNILKCPNCNATISIEDNREYGFCPYCGQKIQLVQTVK